MPRCRRLLSLALVLVTLAALLQACSRHGRPGRASSTQPSTRAAGWQADPKLVEQQQSRRPNDIYSESAVPRYTLPDPLALPDGQRISSRREWEQRLRPHTLDLFRTHVYGWQPAGPFETKFETLLTDDHALDDQATHKRIRITATSAGKSYAFEASILIPHKPKKKVPAFLMINIRSEASADPSRAIKDDFWPVERIIARGYAAAVFRSGDVDADKNDPALRAKGVRGVWPNTRPTGDGWATISAWAWGASRVMDYLVTDPRIDADHVAVIGHSRGGKTALWAGAEDPRFALVISNDSGCGGAALSRRRFGETVATINRGFPYWFCDNFKKYNDRENDLPIDQHQLIALIAPRAVYVASADTDLWADPRGEFLGLAEASPVYALYRNPVLRAAEMPPLESPIQRGRMAYHIRRGGHGLTPYDWDRYMDFADRLWR